MPPKLSVDATPWMEHREAANPRSPDESSATVSRLGRTLSGLSMTDDEQSQKHRAHVEFLERGLRSMSLYDPDRQQYADVISYFRS